jgi:hypothetical protein
MLEGFSDHCPQAEVFGERIEVPVVLQQAIPAPYASGCNHRMDGLANRYADPAQRAGVLRRLNPNPAAPEMVDSNVWIDYFKGTISAQTRP